MKFPADDFPLIRTAVVLLVTSAVLGAASIAGSIYLKDQMRQSKFDDQRRLAEIRGKLDRVREEEQQIRRYHVKYQELVEQGIIGKENRLEWVENIARIKETRKLFDFSYQIAAQQPIQTDAQLSQGEFGLHGSTMKLGFAAMHEEDWLNALNDLKGKGGTPPNTQRNIGLLRECTVARSGNDGGNPDIPNLKAECTMIWLSLKPKNGGAPANSH